MCRRVDNLTNPFCYQSLHAGGVYLRIRHSADDPLLPRRESLPSAELEHLALHIRPAHGVAGELGSSQVGHATI